MKSIQCLIVSLLLLVSTVSAQDYNLQPVSFVSPQESMENIINSPPPTPSFAVPQSPTGTSSNSKNIALASIGGVLMAVGIVLAATSEESCTVTNNSTENPLGGRFFSITQECNNNQLLGGVGVAAAGTGLLIYGLSR